METLWGYSKSGPYKDPYGSLIKVATVTFTRNEKTNAIINDYADGKDVLWLDFNAKFLEPDGTMTKRVMNDLLHPNETGYRIWLDAIGPVFRQVLGK